MSTISCFKPNCVHKIEVSCSCTSPPTYSCKKHIAQHCQSTIVHHNLTSLFIKPVKGTKEAMLKFLIEQKLKNDAIKTEILTSFSQTIYNLEKTFKECLKEIDNDSTKFASYFDKIWQSEKVSRLEKDPILSLLALKSSQEAIEKVKANFSLNNSSFESLNNMRSLIDEIVSAFHKEKAKAIQNERVLTLEFTCMNSEEEEENVEQALSKDIEAIKIDTNNASECNRMWITLKGEKRYEEAVKYYHNAIKIDPNCAAYYANKGNALKELGRREEAIECYQQAIKIEPNNGVIYNSIGEVFIDEKRYEEALKYYNDAIRINQNCALYYKNKGDALYYLGRREEAVECYQRAITIDPNNASAFKGIGLIFYDEKRYKEALKYYNDAIKINPNDASYYIEKGNILKHFFRREEEMECYQQVIKIDPNNADAYSDIGNILNYDEKRYEEAVKYYNNAIRINPNDANYYINKGIALRELGRREEAIESYQQAITKDMMKQKNDLKMHLESTQAVIIL